MTATLTSDRQLVTVETIRALAPIPGADAIEAATVRGWTVVVRKGEVTLGQDVLYFEIDSLLPLGEDDEPTPFTFLAPRGEKLVDGRRYHRLKTAKLRGVYSQGLALPLHPDVFPTLTDPAVLSDPTRLADELGVLKYDEEIPDGACGPFPTRLARKTSADRVQNLTDAWPAILAAGPWTATEKVDGKSCSALRDEDGTLHVCGRNWEVPAPAQADQADVYWRGTLTLLGPDVLPGGDPSRLPLQPGEGVQFEVYGDGIAGNPLRVAGERVAVFTFLRGGQPVPRRDWPAWALEQATPVHPLTLPDTAAAALAQVDGIRSLITPARLAEGIVWTQADARPLRQLDDRITMKAVSNRYLTKNG